MPPLALRSSGTLLANESLMVLKFWLIADGIYIWEFFTNLNYEWNFIRGRQPNRRAIWVYLVARWSTLGVVILNLVSFNVTSEINCQAWAYSIWFSGLLALGSGSLLVLLRIFAIWNMKKVVVAFSTAVWLTNVTIMIIASTQIHTVWEPFRKACVVTNFENCKASVIVIFLADAFLLLVMLAGLLRLRRRGGGTIELGRLLWKQGCIWFAIATATELPQMVLVIVNVNDVIRMMWVFPSLVTMTTAATRMYRSLTNFSLPPNTALDSENERGNALEPNSKQSSAAKLSKRLEVTVHTAFEEHHISQCDGYPGSNGQLADKPDGLSVDSREECRGGKTCPGVIDIGDSENV